MKPVNAKLWQSSEPSLLVQLCTDHPALGTASCVLLCLGFIISCQVNPAPWSTVQFYSLKQVFLSIFPCPGMEGE